MSMTIMNRAIHITQSTRTIYSTAVDPTRTIWLIGIVNTREKAHSVYRQAQTIVIVSMEIKGAENRKALAILIWTRLIPPFLTTKI